MIDAGDVSDAASGILNQMEPIAYIAISVLSIGVIFRAFAWLRAALGLGEPEWDGFMHTINVNGENREVWISEKDHDPSDDITWSERKSRAGH